MGAWETKSVGQIVLQSHLSLQIRVTPFLPRWQKERGSLVLERAILRYSSMNAWAQRYFGLRRALTVEEVKALSREAATSHLKMLVKGLTILPTAIALWFSPAALLTFFAISHGLGLLAVFALVFWAISCFVPLTAGIDDD